MEDFESSASANSATPARGKCGFTAVYSCRSRRANCRPATIIESSGCVKIRQKIPPCRLNQWAINPATESTYPSDIRDVSFGTQSFTLRKFLLETGRPRPATQKRREGAASPNSVKSFRCLAASSLLNSEMV